MKRLIILTSVVALTSGAAHAAILTNTDKSDVKVNVTVGGKSESVTLKSNERYDSKDKPASFTVGSEAAVEAKAPDNLVIKEGKIVAEKPEGKPAETTISAPAEKIVEPMKSDKTPAVPAGEAK